MSSLNRATLIGNLGRDPEIRSMQSGNRCATLSVATSEQWKDKTTGEKRERTEWHRITVFNDGLVGVVEKYLRKGSKVFVEGQLETRKWTDQSGVERYTTEIVLRAYGGQLVLLGDSGGNRAPPPDSDSRDYTAGSGSYGGASYNPAPFDDDIPF